MENIEKNHKIKDHIDVIRDQAIEHVLSFIPGGAIFSSFINHWENLKQKRIIDFSNSLKKCLEEFAEKELHAENFTSEDFIDIMESVYRKVQNTKSELKLERYRNILVKQLIAPVKDYEVQSYLRLLDDLSDIEIIMLDAVQKAVPKIEKKKFPVPLAWYNRESPIVDPGKQYRVFIRIGDEDVPVTDSQIEFLEVGLVSKGLLSLTMDKSPENNYNSEPVTLEAVSEKLEEYRETNFEERFYELSSFTESFLNFIRLEE